MSPPASRSARELLQEARRSFDDKHITTLLRQAASMRPGDAAIARELARALVATGDLQDARAVLSRALEENDGDVDLALRLAELALDGGDHRAATLAVRQALRRQPRNLRAYEILAKSLAMRERWDDRRQLWREFLEQQNDSVEAWCALAQAELQAGDPEVALAAVERAIALDGAQPLSHWLAGIACGDLGRAESRRAHFDRAAGLLTVQGARYEAVYFQLANIYAELGRRRDVVETMHQLARRWPDDATILFSIADWYVFTDLPDLAYCVLRKARRLDPEDEDIAEALRALDEGRNEG